jgi:hypothetical protein
MKGKKLGAPFFGQLFSPMSGKPPRRASGFFLSDGACHRNYRLLNLGSKAE